MVRHHVSALKPASAYEDFSDLQRATDGQSGLFSTVCHSCGIKEGEYYSTRRWTYSLASSSREDFDDADRVLQIIMWLSMQRYSSRVIGLQRDIVHRRRGAILILHHFAAAWSSAPVDFQAIKPGYAGRLLSAGPVFGARKAATCTNNNSKDKAGLPPRAFPPTFSSEMFLRHSAIRHAQRRSSILAWTRVFLILQGGKFLELGAALTALRTQSVFPERPVLRGRVQDPEDSRRGLAARSNQENPRRTSKRIRNLYQFVAAISVNAEEICKILGNRTLVLVSLVTQATIMTI
ncbi:uncharacterized protein LAESUDRAFT_751428 [Laetiporus sulphureus 93-53]|uniref:Uncharacterized protein n=1 Tax=Laetiporus sulphureus 93-53 TaxID=1314785 RepID=A0A165CYY3_9APHY|nr:uncharacterized protein LAESUDRAFT_751428 [Laetiporus sulphureus 93-53]KZT03777.1 hypothetical protein LAESUDRAFT_751428 [Laetiporus sulphureus 93-53]